LILRNVKKNVFKYFKVFPSKIAILINYWDMSSLNDIVGNANLEGDSYAFTIDRFGNPDSAISLVNKNLNIAKDIDIQTDFSILTWVKINSIKANSIFIEFENRFSFGIKMASRLLFQTLTKSIESKSNVIVVDSTRWYHLALTINSNDKIQIYLNGFQVLTTQYSFSLNKTNQTYKSTSKIYFFFY